MKHSNLELVGMLKRIQQIHQIQWKWCHQLLLGAPFARMTVVKPLSNEDGLKLRVHAQR